MTRKKTSGIDDKTVNGMSVVRHSVIQLMERIPELEKLEGDDWYYAEDAIVECVENLIKENN